MRNAVRSPTASSGVLMSAVMRRLPELSILSVPLAASSGMGRFVTMLIDPPVEPRPE
jgi:hypothetical protein